MLRGLIDSQRACLPPVTLYNPTFILEHIKASGHGVKCRKNRYCLRRVTSAFQRLLASVCGAGATAW